MQRGFVYLRFGNVKRNIDFWNGAGPVDFEHPKVAGRFKTIKVNGSPMTARQAPDGRFYVEQNGKYFEVR